MLGACSAGTPSGEPGTGGTGAGAAAGSGGASGSGATAGGAGVGSGGAAATSGVGGTAGAGGFAAAGGAPAGGAAGMAGAGGGGDAGSGGDAGTAGQGGIAGDAGLGGALAMGGDAGIGGSGGDAGASAGTSGAAGTSGTGGAATTCPSTASFCADFEGTGLPAGSSYQPTYQAAQWADFVAIDDTVAHGGSHSFMVKPTGLDGYSYRLLSVPAPAPSFWVRLYVRSDVDLGQSEHNAFFGATTGTGDQNSGDLMEVAEQYCQVVMNLHDDVVTSIGGTMACGSGGVLLAKDTWHCAEAFFDGPNGHIQVFSDGTPVIDKSGWTALTYQTFVFGFLEFHGPSRTMWYDDVAVATERIGCP